MPSQSQDDYENDSSNFAREGYGYFEYLNLLRKPRAEQDAMKIQMVGSTTEVPEVKQNEQE